MKYSMLVLLAATVIVAGCSSTPKTESGAYRQLNGGSPESLFATDLPVESAAEGIALGDEQAAAGKSDHAIYYYVRALDFDPKNADTFYKIGMLHAGKSDVQRAELAFRLALERRPEHAGAAEALGMIMLRRRDYAGAQAMLESAIAHDPARWQAEEGLAAIADLRGQFDEAQGHYQKALALNPQSAQLENNFGYSRYLSGDWDGAEVHYRRAIQNDPKFRQAWQNLGQLKVRRGDSDGAVETFGQILTRAEAENNVGYLSMVSGDYGAAERYFRRAIEDSPSYYGRAERNLEQLQRLKGAGAPGAQSVKTTGP